jgi:hypothetical protein
VTFWGYIKVTVQKLQALPLRAWRLGMSGGWTVIDFCMIRLRNEIESYLPWIMARYRNCYPWSVLSELGLVPPSMSIWLFICWWHMKHMAL